MKTINNKDMYMTNKIEDADELCRPVPFGCGMKRDNPCLMDFQHAEVWATTCRRSGSDYCEVRVFNKKQQVTEIYLIDGY